MMRWCFGSCVLVAVVTGCGPDPDVVLRAKERAERKAAVEAQQGEIAAAVQAAGATLLIPEKSNYDFRYQLQEHLASVQERPVLAVVEAFDISLHEGELVVAGPSKAFTYPYATWIRLRGIDGALIVDLGPGDDLSCLGVASVGTPQDPHIGATQEEGWEFLPLPLVVDVSCSQAWAEP